MQVFERHFEFDEVPMTLAVQPNRALNQALVLRRKGLGVEIAGPVHAHQLLAVQENHARGQPAARAIDPRRTGLGYIEYSIWVASGLVTARPLAPKSQAAWKPSVACDVTQILS